MADSSYDSTTAAVLELAAEAQSNALAVAGRIPAGSYANLTERAFSVSLDSITLEKPAAFSDLFGASTADPAIAALNSDVEAWMAKHFPNMTNLDGIPDDWIAAVVGGTKPFGIESTVFEMVWNQARDRATRTVDSERRTLEANCSKRGFTLPDGALVDALLASEQRGTAAALDVNRDQAMKDAEIKQDLLKVAVQLATQLRLGILTASADLFRAYAALYDNDIQRDRTRASAYAAYMGAMSSYWNVEVSLQQLKLRAAEVQADNSVAINRNRISNVGLMAQNSSLGMATQAFGTIAANAATAAGSLTAKIEAI